MDPKDAVWYVVFPMYKFPELVFKHPKYMLHMYDDTEEFIVNQNVLFEKESDKHINSSANQQTNDVIINPESYNQINNTVNEEPQMNVYNENDNVFLNESLQPDERQETVIEAKKQEIKPEEKPIVVDKSKPKVCPKCGTKLSPTATTCFLCGTTPPEAPFTPQGGGAEGRKPGKPRPDNTGRSVLQGVAPSSLFSGCDASRQLFASVRLHTRIYKDNYCQD